MFALGILLSCFVSTSAASPPAQPAPEASPPSAPSHPAPIRHAIVMFNEGDHHGASLALTELLRLRTYPEHESLLQYYLGRALFDLGLLHSAQRQLALIVEAGPANEFFPYALSKLVTIAEATGDDAEIATLAAGLPPEAFPRNLLNALHYQRGLHHFERGELSEARRYLAQVSDKSHRYWQALYVESIVYRSRGQLKSAVKGATTVARLPDLGPDSPVPADALRDLSLLLIARVYYAIENFDDAEKYFGYVHVDSPYQPDALLGLAWCKFMSGHDAGPTLDKVPDAAWLPEAAYLRGLQHFDAGRYADAMASAEAFEARYRPVQAQLRGGVDRYLGEAGRAPAAEAFHVFGNRTKSALPPALLTAAYRTQDIAEVVGHLDQLRTEEEAVVRQPRKWRDVMGSGLLAGIATDRARLEERAGLALVDRLATEEAYLRDLLYQAEVLRFEAAYAQEVAARDAGAPPPPIAALALLRQLVPHGVTEHQRVEALLRLAALAPAESATIYERVLKEHGAEGAWQIAAIDPTRTFAEATRLVRTWPTSERAPDAWLLLGEHHFARNELTQARAAYEQAAAVPTSPFHAFANYKLGWTLYALGDKAGGHAKLGIAIETTDPKLRAAATAERQKLGGP
jgi:tetratricopeptide (TPR) repeat protein